MTEGVFSFSSFYQRIEEMWPQAWRWIHYHEAFPFGVGLGGISGAQRLYALNDMNAADNMFILMYAYFGVMSFVYLGLSGRDCIAATSHGEQWFTKHTAQAMATLVFLTWLWLCHFAAGRPDGIAVSRCVRSGAWLCQGNMK